VRLESEPPMKDQAVAMELKLARHDPIRIAP
jgi:hypothetical protein